MATTYGTSTSAVFTTLVTNLVLFTVFITCFLLLRLKFTRIYSPKSSHDLVPPDKKPKPLPKLPFRWAHILLTEPASFIIQEAGLDGYFFLRYILNMAFFFLFSLCIWPVLLPVNATAGYHNTGFDQLSISNVSQPLRYYAHAFMSWFFYGGICFVIYRELYCYNSLRLAALSLPKYANLLSSRTILFQGTPDSLLDEKQFFKLYDGVKRIYVARYARQLEALIMKRTNMVARLELATNTLLKKAYKVKLKTEKKGGKIEPSDQIESYIPYEQRPKHKQGHFFSKKVDTIDYCLLELPPLNHQIRHLQKTYRQHHAKNTIFVEFENQYYTQIALQTRVRHTPFRMSSKYSGFNRDDIVWENLRLFWWESIVRKGISAAAIAAVIILWAFPVAFIGVISNINYLIGKLPWLDFINDMPLQLRGVITGLLPTILLSLLMYTLPIFMRAMAQIAGCPTKQLIEGYTQQAYFAFQFINGFLVTTISSSITSTITRLIDKPNEVLSILSEGLPKSSNFYISYLILQGLIITGGSLFQVVGLFLYYILGRLFDNTVRKKWNRFSSLSTVAWGTTFPIFTNLACITLSYGIISPIILLFASVAFFLVYIAYCYNLTYVFVESPDARGSHYPRALFQTFTGIYVGQICLLGLFLVGKGWGPIVLQFIGLGFTLFFHLNLKSAYDELNKVVPIDCMKALDGMSDTPSCQGGSEYPAKVKHQPRDKIIKEQKEVDQVTHDVADENNLLAKDVVPLLADRDFKVLNTNNPIIRFLRPDVFMNFRYAKQKLPSAYDIEPEILDDIHAYDAPAISNKCPSVWLPRDSMGLSQQLIRELSPVVTAFDDNSAFNEKGKFTFLDKPLS